MDKKLILPRRSFLIGLGSLLAAPALIKAESLMPIGNIDHILYPVRGIVDYSVATDQILARIDRANYPLISPKNILKILTNKEIKILFTKEQIASLIPDRGFKQKPQQKYMIYTPNLSYKQLSILGLCNYDTT